MKKSIIEVLQLPENQLPPIVMRFNEDSLGDEVMTVSGEYRGDGWILGSVSIAGKGYLLRFHEYELTKATTFYAIPLCPVVTMHIQVENEAYFGFAGEPEKILFPENQCNLFWQGETVLESHLLPGEHCQLEIHFSPEALTEITGSRRLEQLKSRITTEKHSQVDFYKMTAGKDIEQYMKVFNDAANGKKTKFEKFHSMARNLLFLCLGDD